MGMNEKYAQCVADKQATEDANLALESSGHDWAIYWRTYWNQYWRYYWEEFTK